MKIKVNEFEIENEKDLEKCIRKLLNNATEDKKSRTTKVKLFIELRNIAEKTGEMLKEIFGEDEETVEELEMMVEAQENVLNTYEKILEKRKSH